MGIVGRWIDGCAKAGFDAVAPDSLASYQRSDGLLDATDAVAVAFAKLLVRRGHRDGLAVAQKNTGELLGRHKEIGFDFAVVEECRTLSVTLRDRDVVPAGAPGHRDERC